MAVDVKVSRAWLRINGQLLETLAQSIRFSPGGYERTPVYGEDGVAGYTEKPVAMTCSGSVIIDGAFDIVGVDDGTPVTLTLLLNTGQSLSSSACWFTKPLEYAVDGSGAAAFEINGKPMERA